MKNNQPYTIVNAIFGNNNQLNNSKEEKALAIENEKLKSDLMWALNQLRIQSAILNSLLE